MNDKCLVDSRVDLYDIRTFNDHRRLYSGPFNRSTGKKDRVVLGWLDVAIENRKEKKKKEQRETKDRSLMFQRGRATTFACCVKRQSRLVEEEIHKTIRAKKERRLENETSDEAMKFRK